MPPVAVRIPHDDDQASGRWVPRPPPLVSLPADLTFEGCDPVRITGGALRIDNDGTWQFALAVQDQSGNGEFDDEGTFELNGTALSFESAAYGDSFTGKIDGGLKLDYDYCPDGQSDIQLVFGR
jgi:hypothetical protein